MKVTIYTDGACSGNPGPGGYAFYLMSRGNNLSLRGYKRNTTNNCMELTAVVKALQHAIDVPVNDDKREIEIYSDSAYVVSTINQGWILFWANNNWKTKSDTEVKNKELWQKLFSIVYNKQIAETNSFKFIKVKGHSGNKYNELVDHLAKQSIQDLKAKESPKYGG